MPTEILSQDYLFRVGRIDFIKVIIVFAALSFYNELKHLPCSFACFSLLIM